MVVGDPGQYCSQNGFCVEWSSFIFNNTELSFDSFVSVDDGKSFEFFVPEEDQLRFYVVLLKTDAIEYEVNQDQYLASIDLFGTQVNGNRVGDENGYYYFFTGKPLENNEELIVIFSSNTYYPVDYVQEILNGISMV